MNVKKKTVLIVYHKIWKIDSLISSEWLEPPKIIVEVVVVVVLLSSAGSNGSDTSGSDVGGDGGTV